MTKCVLPWTSLKLYSNHCFACCLSEYGSSTMPPIGNVTRDAFLGVRAPALMWNSDIYQNMRRLMSEGGLEAACQLGQDDSCPFRCGSLATNTDYLSGSGFGNEMQRDNELLAQAAFEAGEQVVSHMPVEIELRLDTICNLACEMCTQIPWRGSQSSLPREILSGMDAMIEKARRLTLTGGEPTISPLFSPIVEQVKSVRGAKIFLITNGHFLRKAILNANNIECFSLVNVSMDAGDPETYQRIRKNGRWADVNENVADLVRAKPDDMHVLVSCVVSGMNYGSLLNVVTNAAELGVTHVVFNEVHSLESVMSGEKLEAWTRHKQDAHTLEASLNDALSVAEGLGMRVNYSIPTISRFG